MKNFSSKELLGSGYAILSGFMYGFLGYFGVNAINSGISYSNMLFWRFLISALFILPFLKLKNFRASSYKTIIKVFFSGLILYSFGTMTYFYSSKYIGTGQSMIIFFVYPAIILIIKMIFFKEKVSKIYYLSFLLIILGMICLIDLDSIKLDILGIVIGILSALFYALYVILSDKIFIDEYVSTFLVSFGCVVTFFITTVLDNSFSFPVGISLWFYLLGLGIITTSIPILLFLQSLKYISSEKASMLSVLEPVFVMIIGIALLGEKVSVIQVVGILMVLSGAIVTLSAKQKKLS